MDFQCGKNEWIRSDGRVGSLNGAVLPGLHYWIPLLKDDLVVLTLEQ